jgi:hypothetical protein
LRQILESEKMSFWLQDYNRHPASFMAVYPDFKNSDTLKGRQTWQWNPPAIHV